MGDWRILTPEVSTNMVLNPVAQGAGNYAAVGANTTITLTTNESYFGYKCYYVLVNPATDNSGLQLTLSALSNAIHYVTMRVYGTLPTAWDWSVNGAQYHAPTLLGVEGDWSVYGYQFPAVECNGATVINIFTNGVYACEYYIGHVQVEAKTYATTPVTGDRKGFCSDGYKWNGTPHAATSTRAAHERSGGREMDLQTDYGFVVKYGNGRGMPPIEHHVQGYALLPGALYEGHKVLPRVLDLYSVTEGTTIAAVAHNRKHLVNAIKPDLVAPEQPVVLRYYGANTNKPVEFHAVYDNGMEANLSGDMNDSPTPRFICYDPFAYGVHEESFTCTNTQTIADADFIVRKVNGQWYNVSTNFDNDVYALTKGLDGGIYIGGAFINVGDANGDYIVKWNPYTNTLSSLGTGTNGIVRALITAPNGDIYLGGDFLLAGGIANTVRIAKWNGSAFVALATGLADGAVWCLAWGQDGSLYVGGSFTNAGADANADKIAYWNGTAFNAIGEVAGADNNVLALAVAPNGDLYAAGAFANIGGVAAAGIARWNGSAWSALGAGLTGDLAIGYALKFDKAGNLYVGGSFTAADGVACANIAKWNGKTFAPLGSGLNDDCYSLYIDNNGLLYAGGLFTSAGGNTLTDRAANWNGTTWSQLDINLPGAAILYSILEAGSDLYLGYSSTGTAYSASTNTITTAVAGSSTAVYPVIHIKRADDGTSATLSGIKNETTGAKLFMNYALQKGETLTIDLTPGNKSIKSDYYGDAWRALLRGSELAAFNLLPGTNLLNFYVKNVGASTITTWLKWRETHWGADMVAA